MSWLETVPPLVICMLGVGAMGSFPAILHRAVHNGKNKRVQRDHFDHLMGKRDARIKESGETLEQLKSQ